MLGATQPEYTAVVRLLPTLYNTGIWPSIDQSGLTSFMCDGRSRNNQRAAKVPFISPPTPPTA
jgi:hypothetical protein